jgi:histidinol-phosphate phosphatase family protein
MDIEGKTKAVFIDRDGTIARDVPYCSRPEDFELFPRTAEAIRLLNEHGFKTIVITNQSGIARGYFDEEMLERIHQKMKDELAKQGAFVDAIYYCPHQSAEQCECRKPKPAMALRAANDHHIDLEDSFVVGDLQMDVDLGKAVGCKTILLRQEQTELQGAAPDHIAADLYQAAEWILKQM